MEIINQLEQKLDQMSNEFQFLIEENRRLRDIIDELKNNNDMVTRDSQDMLMTIKSKLQQRKVEGEEDNISY